MNTQTSYADGTLTVTRHYDAPREDVFDAWIAVAKVEKWWGCGDTTHVKSGVEPRIGGKYEHIMTLKNDFKNPVNGVITEYDPPALLAYEVAGETPDEKMRVRVEFTEKPDGTQVRLVHSGIPDQFSQFVIPGWTAAFDKLGRFLLENAA